MLQRDLLPVHPGEILLEDFLKPLNVTRYRLAKSIGVPQRRVDEICAGKRAISVDTALRLARFFGTDAQSWLNLQAHYDLECAEGELTGRIEHRSDSFQESRVIIGTTNNAIKQVRPLAVPSIYSTKLWDSSVIASQSYYIFLQSR